MTRHATDTQTLHGCGGTILASGDTGEFAHSYCDRCGAYAYDSDARDFPTGTDRHANQVAYDAGEDRSPDATEPSA
jgi:hypothetical protein